MKNTFLMVLSPILLCACSRIPSSYHFAEGTECLDQGDYSSAVFHLEEAVKLDPNLSHNHNNLSYAYWQIGQAQKAWYHSRKAVLLDSSNSEAIESFQLSWLALMEKYQIKNGSPKESVIQALGEPDKEWSDKNKDECVLLYGIILMKFENNALVYIHCIDGKF